MKTKNIILKDDDGVVLGTVSMSDGQINVRPISGVKVHVHKSNALSGIFSGLRSRLTSEGVFSGLKYFATPSKLIWLLFYGLIAYALIASLVRGELV